MKKILLGCLLVLLAVIGAGLYWLRGKALDSDRMAESIRARVSEQLGLSIEWSDLEWRGLNGISVQDFRVLEPPSFGGGEVAFAQSAVIEWNWMGAIVGAAGSFEVKLNEARFRLRRIPDRGWNFHPSVVEPTPERAGSSNPTESDRSEDSTSRLSVQIQAKPVMIEIEEPEWGVWKLQSQEGLSLELSRTSSPAFWSCGVRGQLDATEGTIPQAILAEETLLARFLRPVSPAGASLFADLRFESGDDEIRVRSDVNPSLRFNEANHQVEIGPFSLVLGESLDRGIELTSLTASSIAAKLSDWSSPGIAALRIPWTSPPMGGLSFTLNDGRYREGEHEFALAGLEISAVTFAARDLPWLKILTRQETWGLSNLQVGAAFRIQPEAARYSWERGTLFIENGRGGRLESSGRYQGGDAPEWSVTTKVGDFPLPKQEMEGQVFNPGVLSGTMTWGETITGAGGRELKGEGAIELRNGEIGAIRMLGRIDEILDLEEIATSPFDSLRFSFRQESDRLEVNGLELKSELLGLSGDGTYTSSGRVDIHLLTRPSEKLAEAIRSDRGSLIIRSLSKSNDLRIGIRGDLDSPDYSINPGEGVEIPIGELLNGLINQSD